MINNDIGNGAIKLIAADMDGTLLNAKHELNPVFYPLFQQLKAKQVLFAAASGRQYWNLVNCFTSIKDDIIFVAENGSYVVYKGEEILVQAMDAATIREQLLAVKEIPDTHAILCGKKRAYIQNTNPAFLKNVEMYYDKYEVVNDLMEVENDQFLKIAICDLAGSEKNSYNYFKDKQDELQVKVSGMIWLDLSHKLANKGRAINVLQKKFGITRNETMVFGDYLNDLEMIQQAGHSYAMANAHDDIKKAARFITKSNEENGVTDVLEQLLQTMR